jgi:hypothetical protein
MKRIIVAFLALLLFCSCAYAFEYSERGSILQPPTTVDIHKVDVYIHAPCEKCKKDTYQKIIAVVEHCYATYPATIGHELITKCAECGTVSR